MADPVTQADITALSNILGSLRREEEHNFGTLRREITTDTSDVRRELASDASNIRNEAALNTSDIIKEGLKESFSIRGDVKDTRYDINTRINDSSALQLTATHQVSRDVVDNKIQITSLGYQVRDGFVAASKDMEINALKSQIEIAKQTTYLSDKIDNDGEKTRDLISSLKETELNRKLIERNSELVEARHDGHWTAIQNQLAAFGSSLQETRQGVTNFGSMTGSATSSSNNA